MARFHDILARHLGAEEQGRRRSSPGFTRRSWLRLPIPAFADREGRRHQAKIVLKEQILRSARRLFCIILHQTRRCGAKSDVLDLHQGLADNVCRQIK
jgi:hypothetical protein